MADGQTGTSVPAELRPPQSSSSQRANRAPRRHRPPKQSERAADETRPTPPEDGSSHQQQPQRELQKPRQPRTRNRQPKKAGQSGENVVANGVDDGMTDGTASTVSDKEGHPTNGASGHQSKQKRKQRSFQAKLTTTDQSTTTTPKVSLPTSTSSARHDKRAEQKAVENLTFSERLAHEMSTGKYDCSICFNAISKTAAIHSCTTCHAAFHLACISKWASRSVQETAERAALLATRDPSNTTKVQGTWRCPGCQTTFAAAQVPHEYRCFCRRTKNPTHQPPATPHSCAQQCARPRPGDCKHPCPMQCHPGPCPPCTVVRSMPCHCAKQTLQLRCESLQSGDESVLSCRSACGKELACGLHTCERTCHAGDCGSCEAVRTKTCYCGKSRAEEACGVPRQDRIECFRPSAHADKEPWTGEWSCDLFCDADYGCGKHKCESRCHAHTLSQPEHCPYSPDVLTTCPCGQTRLSTLVDSPRTSCDSPVPTCSKTCSKPLSCGHACLLPCHTGPCGSCNTEIKVVCRCGSTTRTRRCGDPEAHEELLCERVCKAMRACGRHECNRKCCPLAYQEASRGTGKKGRRRLEDVLSDEANDPTGLHICDRTCGRKLSCGIHTCEERDHRGPCPPCLRAGFEELVCNCGSTVMLPPIPCGAVIDCRHPCIREPPCGHPQMPHACHESPECPPCPFLMKKRCACGKKDVANVRCSQERVSCGQTCGKLLHCGYHRCRKLCHASGECEQTCEQICLKPRRICGHPCAEPCHAPSTCPIVNPCPKLVDVQCECGHLKQQTRCATSESKPEGNRDRTLKCTDACAVAKRNAQIAEALGLEKREPKQREVTYDPLLLQFYGANKVWCDEMEAQITDFVKSDKQMLHLPVMKRPQRTFVHELTDYFDIRSESLDEEPRRSVAIHKQSNTGVPTPTLSEAWQATLRQNGSGGLTFGSLRSKNAQQQQQSPILPHNAILFEGVLGYEDHELRDLLAPVMSRSGIQAHYDLKWLPSGEDVLMTFVQNASDAPVHSAGQKRMEHVATLLQNLALDNGMCTSVESVHVSPTTGHVTRGSGAWTPVRSSTPAPAAPPPPVSAQQSTTVTNAWFSNPSVSSKNAFSALSAGAPAFQPSSSSSQKTTSSGSEATIVGPGQYRPPKAVVAPSRPDVEQKPDFRIEPAVVKQQDDVRENWDEEPSSEDIKASLD